MIGIKRKSSIYYPIKKYYKRRIMVGDILTNRTLYADFHNSILNVLPSGEGTPYHSVMFINNENNGEYTYNYGIHYSHDPYTSKKFTVYIGKNRTLSDSTIIYSYDLSQNKLLVDNKIVKVSNDFVDVSKISSTSDSSVAGKTYRCLYIEDSKIRPLKTRDVLKVGTKLYFNIPDNINELYNQYKSNGRTITTRAGEAQNNRVGTEEINNIMNLEYYSTYKVYKISILDLDTKYIFEVDTESQNPKTNISSYEITHQTAIGTYNDYDFWSQYIFVDETTLATSDSFRQVQPGDKVSDTYFIYDFNELKKDILEAPGMGSNVILAIEEDTDIEMTKINNTFSLSFYYVGGMPQIFRASYDTDGQTIDITNDLFRLSDKITDATSGDVTITDETWKVVNDTTFTKYMKVLK